ncbi:MAG: hypothetical protein ABSB71_06390 [Candidatus Bathyarchaeia archaeon]|jgi:hypothetical protein
MTKASKGPSYAVVDVVVELTSFSFTEITRPRRQLEPDSFSAAVKLQPAWRDPAQTFLSNAILKNYTASPYSKRQQKAQ